MDSQLMMKAVIAASLVSFTQDIMTCRVIAQRRSTLSFSGLQFITRFLKGLMFYQYGSLLGDATIYYFGFCSMVIHVTCAAIFSLYDRKRDTFLHQFFAASLFLFLSVAYREIYGKEKRDRMMFAAALACTAHMLTFIAPLMAMVNRVSLRSDLVMTTDTVLQIGITSSAWFLYGCSINNIFLILPSVFGLMVAVAQYIATYVVYRSQPRKKYTFLEATEKFKENLHSEQKKLE